MEDDLRCNAGALPVDPVAEASATAGTWRVVFVNERAAELYLTSRGFSVGRLQRDEPRGILLGDYDIQKWRNLNRGHRAALHGVLQRTRSAIENPTAAVTIFGAAPADAHAAIRSKDGA